MSLVSVHTHTHTHTHGPLQADDYKLMRLIVHEDKNLTILRTIKWAHT